MKPAELINKIEEIQNLLIDQATGGSPPDAKYKELRTELLTNPLIKDEIPNLVKTCRNLNQF